MSTNEPSRELFQRYVEGDRQAADELFHRYIGRLTVFARARMTPKIAQRFDPEDVVLSAYRSFFVRARDGKFSLEQSGDLWRLLVVIVLKKLRRRIRHHRAQKRAVGLEKGLPDGGDSVWEYLLTAEDHSTNEAAFELADLVEAFMLKLSFRDRRIIELRLLGQTIEDVAAELQVNERTVRRILDRLEVNLRRMLCELPDAPDEHPTDPSRSNDEFATNAPDPLPVGDNCRRDPRPKSARPDFAKTAAEISIDAGVPLYSDRDFVLETMVGSGGSGRVYRARRIGSTAPIAVKMLRKAGQADTEVVRRFLDEARTVGELNHPAIVAVLGAGRTRSGGYFLVEEFVPGVSLAERIERGLVNVSTAAEWVAEAASGVDATHQRGIIHCDLKPANLLLDLTGTIRVADFGLAHVVSSIHRSRRAIAGTLGFMAPEQFDPVLGEISPRTDVFGLGAVLYALLYGRPPFSADSIEDSMIAMHRDLAIDNLDAVSPKAQGEINQILKTCLALNPRDRFTSAAEVAERLRQFRHTFSPP